MVSFINTSLQMWCSWCNHHHASGVLLEYHQFLGLSLLSTFWQLLQFQSEGWPAHYKLLQWLGPKVGALSRKEESMVGRWLYGAFPYSNHLCFTSSGLKRSSPLLLRMELDLGLLSIPLVIVLMVLRTSLLLFCCMFVSSTLAFSIEPLFCVIF